MKAHNWIILGVMTVVAACSVPQQTTRIWEYANGPNSSFVDRVDVAPNGDIYVVSSSENMREGRLQTLYLSTNGGGSWTQQNIFEQPWAPVLGIDANNVLYIAGSTRDSAWMFTSNDRGITLNHSPWPAHGVLAFHPFGDGRMYAPSWKHLAFTDDGGTTWNDIRLPADTTKIRELTVIADTVIYIITEEHQLFIGENNGNQWRLDTNKALTHCYKVFSIGDTAYVSTQSGLFKTHNAGKNWTKVNMPPSHKFSNWHEFVLLTPDKKFYGVQWGFSRTVTLGDTMVTRFPLVGYRWTSFNDATIDKNGMLYLASYTGLYILQDDNTWKHTFGNIGQPTYADHVKPLSRNQIVVSSRFGKSILNTDDLTWSSEGLPFLQDENIDDPIPGNDGSILYPTSSSLHRTSDSGRTWETCTMPPGSNAISKLIIDEQGTLHVTSAFHDQDIAGWPKYFKSTDNGDTWLPESDTAKERFVARTSTNLWFGWEYNTPPYLSVDNGKSWQMLSDSIRCEGLFIAPNDDVYIVTEHHLYISDDTGRTWKRRPMPLGNWVQDMVWDSHDNPYIAIRDESKEEHRSGVYMSMDSCETWTRLDFHFSTPTICTDLLFHADGRIYAATNKGVFRTVLPAEALKLPKVE